MVPALRFVAHYTDAIAPVTNDKLHYIFQGWLTMGRQYISAAIPIAAAFLPDSAETVAPGVANEVSADSNAYFKRIDAEISAAADDDFTPSLAALDALMASIQIDMSARQRRAPAAPTANRYADPGTDSDAADITLAGVVWQWQSVKSSSGDLPINKPAVYTLELLDDGVVRLQTDRNYANGNFSLDGDTIAINVIETTKSVCASGSMSSQFVQFYRLHSAFCVKMTQCNSCWTRIMC